MARPPFLPSFFNPSNNTHTSRKYQRTHQNTNVHTRTQPALGAVFADLLAAGNYTHWGFGDMDMLMGRLFLPPSPNSGRRGQQGWWGEEHPFVVTAQDLGRFDALTFSFGDQFRGYLR